MSDAPKVRKRQRGKDADSSRQEQQTDQPALIQGDGSPGSEFEGSNVGTGISADDARLCMLFIMQLRAFTQKEMARQFDVTTRTIRNWLPKLANLKLPILENIDANDEVGRILCRYAAREADLLQWKRTVETDRDTRAMVAISRELRQLEKGRYEFLRQLGLFNGLRLRNHADDDPSARQADLLTGMVYDLLAVANPPCGIDDEQTGE